ncbi:MAG: AarF/ABC1/UbiB kinase family protein [Reyranella sp.]|uniref:ABC1 kinase family protein n=1 Tax=Reyranella sp. TaxID=1929291 RepID=UPI001AC532A4|nr:AarF/ABC1/UbiB kinase family protein [Reyranella sp.]MBN9087598.1 AarF/ABC1/UbiB kinase family protein [Reyranella sp.]
MADDEGPSLGGRLGRYARVGASVGGLAVRLAGERYLGWTLDRDKHAAELKSALGGLKGPLMKAAQLLATIPDALPPEYARELAQLQANAPAMGWAFVKRRMATELGPDWQAKFRKFDKEASFAASLGQVHHAILPANHPLGGREVAAKLQYPDMASALEADLDQLKVVFAVGQRFDPAIRTDEIQAEIRTRLREELDYRREAKHVALYCHMLRDEPNVHVPETVPDYSTDRLLTMSWLAGEPLLNWKARSQEERDALAINMFRAWYVPFYVYGVIHGDPHLGNYSVRPDGSVNLMDFGCVRVFPPRFVRGSIELYRALMSDDTDRAVAAYEDWGFAGLSRGMIAVLNRWAAFLYGPLMDDRPRRLTEGMAEGHGRDMAQNVFGELRRMGGVRPPREFVFMDRAAIGLGAVFIHLRASINWHRLFEGLIDGFDVDALASRQQDALAHAGL